MNRWTELSIEYANQRSYLDDLFRVYPTIPEGIRDINGNVWSEIEDAFNSRDNILLIKKLLSMDLFPIKDSYVAYLKRDINSIDRNPQTVNRLCGRLYEMGLNKLFERCTEPKETNRQIGPMFKQWMRNKSLGIDTVPLDVFISNKNNAILDASDYEMKRFASTHLGYDRDKGLDFLARFNGQYVIGEAKFLTDFGGHQNAQFEDAISTMNSSVNAIKIGILDGVLYINSNNKLCSAIRSENNYNIMSALVLREFLYQL